MYNFKLWDFVLQNKKNVMYNVTLRYYAII